jgi:periplasmic protein TonB
LLATNHPVMPLTLASSQTIEIALEPEAAAPVPPPPAPEPPKVIRPQVHHETQPRAAAPLMAVVSEPADFPPAEDSPPSEAIEMPPPLSAPSGSIEAQYAATLRSNIDSRTSSPTSAEYRLLKPHGEVRVNFILERSGMMISSDLARSSGSGLLDRHALEIVKTGHYPPFPEAAFKGESRHSFLITLEFHS